MAFQGSGLRRTLDNPRTLFAAAPAWLNDGISWAFVVVKVCRSPTVCRAEGDPSLFNTSKKSTKALAAMLLSHHDICYMLKSRELFSALLLTRSGQSPATPSNPNLLPPRRMLPSPPPPAPSCLSPTMLMDANRRK